MRLAPADGLDRVLQDRGPDRPGQVVAARHDRHGDAAPTDEPVRDVGDQGPEGGGAPEHADQQRLRQDELPVGRRVGGRDVPGAEHERAEDDGDPDPEAVGEAPHRHAAEREADQRGGVGRRGAAAVDAELLLDGGQHDDRRPQADAADRGQRERGGEAPPSVGAVRPVRIPRRDQRGHPRPAAATNREAARVIGRRAVPGKVPGAWQPCAGPRGCCRGGVGGHGLDMSRRGGDEPGRPEQPSRPRRTERLVGLGGGLVVPCCSGAGVSPS